MRETSFVKIREFLLDKTEPNIENIKTFFSEEEISYINDTTPDEFVEINYIEDTEIKEKYKKIRAIIFDSYLQSDTVEDQENDEETNIKDYLFKEFNL